MPRHFPTTAQPLTVHAAPLTAALLAALTLSPFLAGCQSDDPLNPPRPVIPARFSASPVLPGVEHQTLGLYVVSGTHPQTLQYAGRLVTSVAREIQLLSSGIQIVRCTELPVAGGQYAPLPIPAEDSDSPLDFQDPLAALPPDAAPLGPLSAGPAEPANYDRVLKLQLVSLRPYAPMTATLRITLLDGVTLATIAETTADWDSSRPAAHCGDPDCRRHHLHCWSPGCAPSPLQNSPDAMIDLMAEQVAAWYAGTMPRPVVIVEEDL